MTRTQPAAGLLLTALMLAGCGGGSSGTAPSDVAANNSANIAANDPAANPAASGETPATVGPASTPVIPLTSTAPVALGAGNPAATTPVAGARLPNSAKICFYEHINYAGRSFCAEANSGWVGAFWNDRVSSFKLETGYQAEIFLDINYGGKVLKFKSDTADLRSQSFNDRLSAFKVSTIAQTPPPAPPTPPPVTPPPVTPPTTPPKPPPTTPPTTPPATPPTTPPTTPPPPTATTAARIASIELGQSHLFPSGDSALVLVAGKDVLVKVNVTTNAPSAAKPQAVLQVQNSSGQLVGAPITLTPPTAAIPANVPDVPSFATSYTTVLPGNLVRDGLRLTTSLTGSSQAPNTINPRVGGGVALTIVPIAVQFGSTAGNIPSDIASYVQPRIPASSVRVTSRPPYVPSGVRSLPTSEPAWSSAFGTVLGELADLHQLEGASNRTHYYGFMPKRTYGLAGLGYVRGTAALGFDVNANAALGTMQHELGHNLSLPHANCGGATGTDPAYPYANALLGAPGRYIWGYNATTKTFIDPRNTREHDLMSYCDGDTFSDYNYRKIQTYLTPTDRQEIEADVAGAAGGAAPAATSQRMMLISGQINGASVQMRPLKSLQGELKPLTAGPYTVRIVTADNTTLEYRFAARELDHDVDAQHFGFTIAHPGPIASMSIVRGGTTLLRSQARATPLADTGTANKSAATGISLVQASEQGGALRLTWDQIRYPYLTVTHVGAQRTNLSQDLEGGTATLPLQSLPAGGKWEFSLSDGLNTAQISQAR